MMKMNVADLAERFGTPLYLYDRETIEYQISQARTAAGNAASIFYAVKANPNPSLLRIFNEYGFGFEAASAGEIKVLLRSGISPDKVIFSGPGKTTDELDYAITHGISLFNVESEQELRTIHALCARRHCRARVNLRVNLNLDGFKLRRRTNWFSVNKFGIVEADLPSAIRLCGQSDAVRLTGLHVHMASDICDTPVYVQYLQFISGKLLDIVRTYGLDIDCIDLGGGWGTPDHPGDPCLDVAQIRDALADIKSRFAEAGVRCTLMIELGRYLMSAGGALATRIVTVKSCRGKQYIVADAGVNMCLFKSSTYRIRGQKQAVKLVRANPAPAPAPSGPYDIVGPLCTPIDSLANDVSFDAAPRAGDLILFENMGAYCKMASPLNFLGHDWPAEVLVSGEDVSLIARKLEFSEIIALQSPIPSDGL